MTHRVQVPLARGSVIPEIDSMREDLPALCDPITAIIGRSMSNCTLQNSQHEAEHEGVDHLPSAMEAIYEVEQFASSL